MKSKIPVDNRKEALVQLFARRFPQKVEHLNLYLKEIQLKGWSDEKLPTLKKNLENISFISNTISDPPISAITDKLSELAQPVIELGVIPDTELIANLQGYVMMLKETIEVNLGTKEEPDREHQLPKKHHLIIALKDKKLVEEILNQVKYFNYDCISCNTLDEIIETSKAEHAANHFGAVILDTNFCSKNRLEDIMELGKIIPIIFISNKQDVGTRLFCAKVGGHAFLTRPLEFTTLVEKIDHAVLPSNEGSPFRILIVEDSKTQANIIKEYLESANMVAEIMTAPIKINDMLKEFQPDLILMDLYMPEYSGIDLAKVIRQQDLFVSIPIVFLSAEDDVEKQLEAMILGGDDFLTKPIEPKHLIASVTARAKRSRTLRREMIQDSLTGLLNHTRVLEELELEIARAKRNHTKLSFAMIDIDHFKSVNDSHGHPVGDRVIQGLARLLKQRLRKTDSIGRYGGEEFAVIFPDSSAEAVEKKLEEIRKTFARLLHQSSDPHIEFSCTFSAGIAELSPGNHNVDKVVQNADKALYIAKEKGRNRIIISGKSS